MFFLCVFCYFAHCMKKYHIEETETLSRVVEIVAENDVEAIEIARTMYRQCDLVLDASDYVLTEFSVKDE